MENPLRLTCRLLALALVLALASCARAGKEGASAPGDQYPSTADPRIVSSHVSGPLSIESRIQVRFVDDIVKPESVGKQVAAGSVSISPRIPGAVVWADSKTIELKPSGHVPRGVIYRVTVSPQKLDARFDASSTFSFHFSIMNQALTMDSTGLRSAGSKDIYEMKFVGIVHTSDAEQDKAVEKSFQATLNGAAVTAEWVHGKRDHAFTIKGIVKQENPRHLSIRLAGAPVGARVNSSAEFEIPARSVFKAMDAQALVSPERYIQVSFSDPLLQNQEYRGLVTVNPARTLRFDAQDNVLKVYSVTDWPEGVEVAVSPQVKNAAGESLSQAVRLPVVFSPVLPQARFIGNGVIVPRKDGVTIPIETVNLNAVIVEIQKIYASNIDQFLQVNDLSGSNELFRVGTTIWKKIVPLPFTDARRNEWIRTALDLSPLVKDDEHSLYRITLRFDIRQVAYPALTLSEEELMAYPIEDLPFSEQAPNSRQLSSTFWAAYAASDSRSSEDRDYRERNDPTKPGYYRYRWDRPEDPARNFLVSTIGLIAHEDTRGTLSLAVSDLLTAQPLKDAVVTVYDYALQKIAEARTDSSGLAALSLDAWPFLVVAESRDSRGYLKLEGASSLPVSSFDVTGQEVQQGIKGFIYAERGVWRPGDPIALTFILQDSNGVLPKEHPVILKMYNPRGALVTMVSRSDPVGSFYQFALSTGPDDPTGTYGVRISVGDLQFTKDLPVETVKPNRLRIGVGFKGNPPELSAQTATGVLDVQWLHGAPAANMGADVSVQLVSTATSFPDYRGYTFDDPVRKFSAEDKDVYQGALDSNGHAQFSVLLAPDAIAPGKLIANFKTRVREPGGNLSTDTFSIPFHPYARYAGVRIADAERDQGWLDVDQPHTVQIVVVNNQGKAVDSADVKVEIYELGWRWWWDRHEDNIADYLGSEDYRLVSSCTVHVSGGVAEWTLKLSERVWGRYLVRVRDTRGGHATGQIVYMRWPGWYYTGAEGGGDSASMLVFQSDKPSYTVGETAKITIPTSENGRALVSIECRGSLLSTQWIDTNAGQTIYSLKITDRMVPNVYVHVSHVQPHGQTSNDRPIRMFGIIPLLVEDPATRLAPRIQTADSFEPETSVNVSVSEATGKPMTYTLAVVDVGLLSLTRFPTPDPWGFFYKREALSVATFDMYGFVAAAYGGTLERLLAVGGGEGGQGPEGQKANRFPPMVVTMGPFQLRPGQTAIHAVPIPAYSGAVRVMVVAGNDRAYGYAEKEVTVKKPVMVYATLPRVVSVTEKFSLPATVFAMEPGIKSVKVSVKASGGIKVTGRDTTTVSFSAVGEKTVTFELAAGSTPRVGTVEVVASSGSISSRQTVELDVRAPNAPITTTDAFVLNAGEKKGLDVELPGISGTNKAVLEVSRIAPLNLEGRLGYLIAYPYGCIEQTTSAVFPQLYLDKITRLSAREAEETKNNIQRGIERLQHFQTDSGGFSYWPGEAAPSSWGTTYACHFLLEAEKLGYVVPSAMKDAALSYLRLQTDGSSWNVDRGDLTQAYALYDLALAADPNLGAMNRLRETRNLAIEVRYLLAGAYALAGQKQEAVRLTEGVIPAFTPYVDLGGTFGSDLRDLALLAAGLLESGAVDRAAPLIREISDSLASSNWYSTQTTAYCLLVVGKYLRTWKADAPMKITYAWGGKAGTLESGSPVARAGLEVSDGALSKALQVTNASSGPLFLRVLKTGNPPLGSETASANGLGLQVEYTDSDGNFLDVSRLPQGTDIVAVITVTNPSRRSYEQIAMTYVAPSGWEITNTRLEGTTVEGDDRLIYQDIRDDRVSTFLNVRPGRSRTFRLLLNASYLGTFYLPQSKVEAMYDASISAAVQGMWINVVPGDE